MKAFVVTHHSPDGLEEAEVPTPAVGPHDVLVDVRAASINPLDKMVRDGEFKQLIKYKRPFILGHDVAGVVTQVGSGVRGFDVGDEVYARPRDLRIGTFAEASRSTPPTSRSSRSRCRSRKRPPCRSWRSPPGRPWWTWPPSSRARRSWSMPVPAASGRR
jgi:hypothetical protein